MVGNFFKKLKFMKKFRTVRTFSDAFKREKVELISLGKLKIAEVSKIYGVSKSAVYVWIQKYGKIAPGERIVVEKVSEAAKTLELQKKIAELERVIGRQQVKIEYQDAVIDIGSELLGEKIKKKYDSQQSKE